MEVHCHHTSFCKEKEMKRFALTLAAFCLLFWALGSCSMDTAAAADTPASDPIPEIPKPLSLLSLDVVSETELDFEFSAPVKVLSLSFDPSLEIADIGEGSTVRVLLDDELESGAKITAGIHAQDEEGNTFNGTVPFEFKKNTSQEEPVLLIPELRINELRTEYATNPLIRVEFIEFTIESDGNLSDLCVFMYRSGSKTPTEFTFPSTNVKAGEYAVLYLRTLENASGDVNPDAHNFWIPDDKSRINKTSAVYVQDKEGKVQSAVMISESDDAEWWTASARKHFTEVAAFLFEKGAWKSASGKAATPADAVMSQRIGTGVTRSISRDETVGNTNTAADWYITATNGATPGTANNPKRLE